MHRERERERERDTVQKCGMCDEIELLEDDTLASSPCWMFLMPWMLISQYAATLHSTYTRQGTDFSEFCF
jgi:hypothetical protein